MMTEFREGYLLKSIINASLDAIVCADEEGKIILWNPAAEAMSGYTEDEAIGQPLTMLLCEEDRAAHLAGIRRFMETGEGRLIGRVTETMGLRKDGTTFPKEMSLSAEKMEGKWIFTAILRDISERRKAEEIFHNLVASTAVVTGAAFFDTLVNDLCTWLNVECAIVGKLAHENRVRALAMQLDGKPVPAFEYDLPGTPCENVAAKGYCAYPEKIRELFPGDRDLAEMQGEGYVGTPVKDKHGKALGILCAISRKPLQLPPYTEVVFAILAARAAAEIARRRMEQALRGRLSEIQRMNRLMVGRELKMEDLRHEIKGLKQEIAGFRTQ